MQKKSCITRYCIKEFINFREIKEFSKFTIFVKETFQVRHQLKFCIICSLKVGLKPKFRSHIFDLKHIELKTFLGVIYLLLKQLSRTWVLLRSENIIWVVSGSVRQLLFPTQDLNQFLEKSQKILGNPRIYSQKIPILGFFIFMGFRNPYCLVTTKEKWKLSWNSKTTSDFQNWFRLVDDYTALICWQSYISCGRCGSE